MIHVVVYGFHPTAHEISLVPKSGSPGVFQEVLPPDAMRFRARPPLEGFEIAPILAHAEMGRKQTEEKILVKQQPLRLCVDGLLDSRTKANHRLQAAKHVHPHAKIDDD